MTPEVQSFEAIAWLIVLVMAVIAAALGSNTAREAVEQRERPSDDDDFRWRR
jgi:hypothetical protein